MLFFLSLRRNPVGIQLHTPIGIAIAVNKELGSVIVSFTGILGPIMKHSFLTAPATFPDDHRAGRGLGKTQHTGHYVVVRRFEATFITGVDTAVIASLRRNAQG